jgi:DNA (cytosine-5)-methyltransferase 1
VNELHLFAGAGGGILGGMLLGHTCVCAVEIEPYCRKVLLQRQRDGILPKFPIWDDVRTFDGRPWRGRVDLVAGGFPCQDISHAGGWANGQKGINGERSGLWSEMFRVVCEIRPRHAFIENSSNLLIYGFERVLSDLASVGYDAKWGVLRASDVGAIHERSRIWVRATDPTKSDFKVLEFKASSLYRPNHLNGNLKEQLMQRYRRWVTPICCETMMMWPVGWTDLAPLATDRFQQWLNSHGRH